MSKLKQRLMEKSRHLPLAVESHLDLEGSDEEIELELGVFSFAGEGVEHTESGVIALALSPQPTIMGVINEERPDLFLEPVEVSVNGEVKEKARVTSSGAGRTTIRLGKHETEATEVDYVDVHVVNMVRLNGDSVRYSSGGISNGRSVFNHEGWKLTLDAVLGSEKLIRRLRKTRGFGVTHMLRMERDDGGRFSTDDVPAVFSDLQLLLSFIAGIRVGLVAAFGFHREKPQPEWVSFNDPWTQPMSSLRSWMNHQEQNSGEVAATAIHKIWPILDEDWSNILNSYLSSDTQPIDVGVVTVQSALEKLAHKVLKLEEQKPLGRSAAEKIRAVASHFGMSVDVPDSSPSLKELIECEEKDLKDGVGGSAWVRNALVHGDPKKRPKLESLPHIKFEAWFFMINLLVEAILRRAAYKGKVCRIADPSNCITLE